MNDEMNLLRKQLKANIQQLIDKGELNKAKEVAEQYRSIANDDIEAYSILSVILIMENNFDEAKDVLMQGLKINETNFDLNYNLAYIYEQTEEYNKALGHYNKAENYCSDVKLKAEIKTIINNIMDKNNFSMNIIDETVILKTNIRKILFVQSIPDIRTNKIAQVLADRNIETDIMYFAMHPGDVYKGFKLPYKKIYRIEDVNQTINMVNESDYDVIFSCNEPDYLTALLLSTNKPVVHDCHDMMSLRGNITNEQIVIEYLANNNSAGNVYVTNNVRKIAEKKFSVSNKPVMTLDNYILRNQLPKRFLPKLSSLDGEIHCVYEGGLTNVDGHHRNIQDIFMKLAENNIHVHYYAPFENDYYKELGSKSKYLHCEGTKEPNELIEDMTKYDIGLVVLNVTERNRTFLDTTFPNKAWEYLAAGLPLLLSDLTSFRDFLNKYNVGEIINFKGSIRKQVERVKKVKISSNFLIENKLCMDDFFENLYEFLCDVKKRKYTNFNKIEEDRNHSELRNLKNILIMTPAMGVGGAEEYTVGKAKWLVDHGYNVAVISKGGEWVKRLCEFGAKHYEIEWICHEDPGLLSEEELNNRLKLLKEIVDKEKVDIIEGHNLYPAVYGYLISQKYNIPYLFYCLNTIDFTQNRKYIPFLFELNNKGLYYIANGAANKDIENVNGIRLEKCKVVPIAIELNESKDLIKERYILTVCRMAPTKMYVFYLIRDFVKMCLNEKLCNYKLIVVGDGPLFDNLMQIVNDYNMSLKELNSNIELKGFVYGDELERLYNNCEMFVGIGLSALKAAAYRKPVILATHHPYDTTIAYGYFTEPEFIAPVGKTLDLLPKNSYYNYMISLINNNKLYKEVSNKCYDTYSNSFSMDTIMSQWINEYDSIVNRKESR